MKDYALDILAPDNGSHRTDIDVTAWPSANRPNTNGISTVSLETLKTFVESRDKPSSLYEVSSTKHAVVALYLMKGKDFIQEHRGDDATIQLLRSLPLAYQIDVLVNKFKDGSYDYPSADTITSIMSEMEDEGMFGPCDSLA